MHSFIISTGKSVMELVLTDDGRFVRRRAEGPGFSYGGESEEFFFTWDGTRYSGFTPGWRFVSEEKSEGTQGEEITALTIERDGIRVTREYTAYPGQSAIGARTVLRNTGSAAAAVSNPSILAMRGAESADSYAYMTGGANFTGSLMYKEVPLTEGYSRGFDSHGEPEVTEVEGRKHNSMHPVPNGTGIWCELYSFQNAEGRGWITFDFQGWWKSLVTRVDGVTLLRVWCELRRWEVAPGEEMAIAGAVFGFAAGDTDDMGNDISAYIYAYKWDYTRERYFLEPTTTIWREAPLTDKDFWLTREAQQIGARQIHVDDFWFDAKGNWNNIFGDDFREFNDYLKRLGLDFRLWMPPWHVDRLSDLWLEHPDWMLNFHGNWYNWTLDLSKEEAYQWMLDMVCRKQEQFGTYMLRVDGNPTCLRNDGGFTTEGGDYDAAYKQSENFYRFYRAFKDRCPEAGLNGCSSGGHTMTIESVRYTDTQQITDGECLHYGGYWAPLFNPVDKVCALAGGSMNLNPETQQRPAEELRKMRAHTVFCNWARRVGLAGRGILVYRPEVRTGDKTFWFERLSADRSRGMITMLGGKNPFAGKPEVVFPKGLDPERSYRVESEDGSFAPQVRTGAEWMADGIRLEKTGSALYFNLGDRPGMNAGGKAPDAPANLHFAKEHWLHRDGAMVLWDEPSGDVLLSHAELWKNGELLAEVASGHGWFDDAYAEGDSYRARFVDADGNVSGWADAAAR